MIAVMIPPANRLVAITPSDDRCPDTITRLCNADALDVLCTDNSSYDTARESACRKTPSDNRCPDTITRVCTDNPFDALCNDTYNNDRESVCRNDNSDNRCPDTITRLCNADALDELCTDNSGYDTARESACRENPKR